MFGVMALLELLFLTESALNPAKVLHLHNVYLYVFI